MIERGAPFDADQAARRAGVTTEFFERLITLGIVHADASGTFGAGQVRRAQMAQTLDRAGIPVDGLASLIARGEVSLDFFDSPDYERFPLLADETFAEANQRTGVSFELLTAMREASGLAAPSPTDHLRETELLMLPFLATQVRLGFRPIATERLLRVMGDSLRRISEQESSWWRTEVIDPAVERGRHGERLTQTFAFEDSNLLATQEEQHLIALYNAHRTRAWSANIVATLETELEHAGLHSRLERPPAMAFLDVTGYTRLTQERGDEAGAALAGKLGRLVQRTAATHSGRAVKWLGDGVMLYFDEPVGAVTASLEMLDGVAEAGLPPAHIGIHAGPVLFQEGDYFGATVNLASRIGEYARPGEVLVSAPVAQHAADAASFSSIGAVELKGVGSAIELFSARRPA
jgi:adenylate cyclase